LPVNARQPTDSTGTTGQLARREKTSVMSVSALDTGERLALERGSIAVCIPLTTDPDLFYRCFRSVLAHTASSVPLVLV